VDAVLVPAGKGAEHASAFARSIAGLQRRCPWLRLLFLVLDGEELPDLPHAPANLRPVGGGDFPASAAGPDPARAAHDLPGLSEQYLLVRAGSAPERDMLPSDFFSPNGIPFVFLDRTEKGPATFSAVSGIFAQTKENSADFLAGLAGVAGVSNPVPSGAECRDYFTSAGRWACSAGRAVPLYR
jgi:hypothetical protein